MSKSMTPSEREAYAFGYDMGKMAEADAQLTGDDYELGRRVGVKAEREAIVAWLRDEETWRRVARGNLAVFIERGDHLGASDE